MVKIEIITPEEYKKIGRDLTIIYGFHNGNFGHFLLGVMKDRKNSICHLAFCGKEEEKGLKMLQEKWKLSELIKDQEKTESFSDDLFQKIENGQIDDVNVTLKGTEFQITVWKALTEIHPGDLVTYKDMAEMIENPKATRAVASALAANQVGYLIPCHRVVCKNGCNKFSWAGKVKEQMQNFDKGKYK